MDIIIQENPKISKSDGLVHEIPTLYYEQLFGPILSTPNGHKQQRHVRLDEAYIWAFGGARGAGKSESLDYLGVKAMASGLPVWANFPIKFYFVDRWDRSHTLESKPLYFKDIFKLSPDLHGGWILIDEYQDWDNALMFMSTQSRLLQAFWAQIRKNDLSFAYGSKKLKWIGYKTREETDIDVICRDSFFSDGYGKLDRGEVIYWNIMDLSGMWTGRPFEEHPVIHHKRLYAKILWGSYDTKLRFDLFEALKGVKLNLEKEQIGGAQDEPIDYDLIEMKVNRLFNEREKIQPTDLKAALGIRNQFRWSEIKTFLPNIGVEQRGSLSRPYFERVNARADDDAILFK